MPGFDGKVNYPVYPAGSNQVTLDDLDARLKLQEEVLLGLTAGLFDQLQTALQEQEGIVGAIGQRARTVLGTQVAKGAKMANALVLPLSTALADQIGTQQSMVEQLPAAAGGGAPPPGQAKPGFPIDYPACQISIEGGLNQPITQDEITQIQAFTAAGGVLYSGIPGAGLQTYTPASSQFYLSTKTGPVSWTLECQTGSSQQPESGPTPAAPATVPASIPPGGPAAALPPLPAECAGNPTVQAALPRRRAAPPGITLPPGCIYIVDQANQAGPFPGGILCCGTGEVTPILPPPGPATVPIQSPVPVEAPAQQPAPVAVTPPGPAISPSTCTCPVCGTPVPLPVEPTAPVLVPGGRGRPVPDEIRVNTQGTVEAVFRKLERQDWDSIVEEYLAAVEPVWAGIAPTERDPLQLATRTYTPPGSEAIA